MSVGILSYVSNDSLFKAFLIEFCWLGSGPWVEVACQPSNEEGEGGLRGEGEREERGGGL